MKMASSGAHLEAAQMPVQYFQTQDAKRKILTAKRLPSASKCPDAIPSPLMSAQKSGAMTF